MVRPEGRTDIAMIRKEYPLKPEDSRVWTKQEIEELFATDVASFDASVSLYYYEEDNIGD